MTFNLMFFKSRENIISRERLDSSGQPFPIEYILLTPVDGTAAAPRPRGHWLIYYYRPGRGWTGQAGPPVPRVL